MLKPDVKGLITCVQFTLILSSRPVGVAVALTILALVSEEVCHTAAGGLVSTVNCAVSSVLTVVLTCALVTVGSCEACQTTASRSS